MNEERPEKNVSQGQPRAVIKSGRSLSIIWVVPIVALLIGGWLTLKAWSERGPVVTIAFETAEGLEANKTKIRFKEVEVGKVTGITLNDDLSGVIVTAEMNKSVSKYMRDATQFWVVRARVAAGEVSGLDTLFSGAYIGCSLSDQGTATNRFVGLEKPPVVTSETEGHHFVLESTDLGSLDVGSPVYYRGIKVGQVIEYEFDSLAETVNVHIFINAPYHEKVRKNSRFWNVSGVDFRVSTEGVSIDTQSLVSILLGGIAFDLPNYMAPLEAAAEGQVFRLYENREKVEERSYSVKHYYRMYFEENVRGLLPGAPVEMRGIRIGEVIDVNLEVDLDDVTARVAVLAMVEPERIDTLSGRSEPTADMQSGDAADGRETIARLVAKGLRAQLNYGNLLTGQLYVDLDLFENADPAEITERDGYLVLPTRPTTFEQIADRIDNILKEVEKMPLVEISEELKTSLATLNATLDESRKIVGGFNRDIVPQLKTALGDFQTAMQGVDQTLGPDSAINYNADQMMREMTAAIRALRTLIDSLEENPQSILFGREEEQ
ncbi:MAG: MlaD family protein [Desulfuromonadales bacterium]